MNHLIPYIQLTNIQSKEKECGSPVSNNKGRNTAINDKIDYETNKELYGYPFLEDKCNTIFRDFVYGEADLDDGLDNDGNMTYLEYSN